MRARLWPVCCAGLTGERPPGLHGAVQRLSMCPSSVYHCVGPVEPVVMGRGQEGAGVRSLTGSHASCDERVVSRKWRQQNHRWVSRITGGFL